MSERHLPQNTPELSKIKLTIDPDIYDHISSVSINEDLIAARLAAGGLDEQQIARTRLILNTSSGYNKNTKSRPLASYDHDRAYVFLHVPNIINDSCDTTRFANEEWLTNSSIWNDLSINEKFNKTLDHELQHRIDFEQSPDAADYYLGLADKLGQRRRRRDKWLDKISVGLGSTAFTGVYAIDAIDNSLIEKTTMVAAGVIVCMSVYTAGHKYIIRKHLNEYCSLPHEASANTASFNCTNEYLSINI